MPQTLTTVHLQHGRPSAIHVQGAELVVQEGPDAGRRASLAQRSLSIGTAAGNDLVLTDNAVSRFHCRVDVAEDVFVLRDTSSSNGTFVNGVAIRECLLASGQQIKIGNTAVLFRWLLQPVEIALSADGRFGDAIGTGVAMRELFALLERAAGTDAPVLLGGETGTGKEVLAQAIHQRSRRADGPFEVFDCSATPPTLIEAELFGYEKGSFTGAVSARTGVFERAYGGTVFLDELGELPLELQPKLLRVLESREVRRLGARASSPVDVRVVAATNRDVDAMVRARTLRADLYHRVAVIVARIPPLRDRREDVPVLVAHFLENARFVHDAPTPEVRQYVERSIASLRDYGWPGNVRELRNAVERAVILADPAKFAEPDAPPASVDAAREGVVVGGIGQLPMRVASDEFEREYLIALLRAAGRGVVRAAEIAQVHPKSIERLLRKHGLRAKDV